MSSTNTVFNEQRTRFVLVKVEADSPEHAEQLIAGALSYAQASGNLGTTYEVICAVKVEAGSNDALADALAED